MRKIFLIYIQQNISWTKQIHSTVISISDINIKVIDSNIHCSIYKESADSGSPIANFPWLSGNVPRCQSYGITFCSSFGLLGVVLACWIYILKSLKKTLKLLTQGYRYHKLLNTFMKFFRSYSELLYNLMQYRSGLCLWFSSALLSWSWLQTRSEFHLLGFEYKTPLTSTVILNYSPVRARGV